MTELSNIEEEELRVLFYQCCTAISLISGKKLNIANVFLQFLRNNHVRGIFRRKLDVDTNQEVVKIFFKFDPALYRSKYIMKFLNTGPKIIPP